LTTLAALISGIVGSKSTQLPSVATKIPDGTALIIHATADDDSTDPAGNAGDRIACGVITKAAAKKK
jgi:Cu-Zn family superoxide dismutase